MFNERAANTCSLLWAQSNVSTTFVVEVVHLFGYNLGGFSESQKNIEVFKHRRDDVVIASRFDRLGKDFLKCPPTT